jgi:hypothetical protein
MQIKTLAIFALAVACASAENATYGRMLIVSTADEFQAGRCITVFGGASDPFNAVGMQDCNNGTSQLWYFDVSAGTLCLQNGNCMTTAYIADPTVPQDGTGHGAVIAAPTDPTGPPTSFAFNPSSGSLSVDGACTVLLNMQRSASDIPAVLTTWGHGTEGGDCNNPADNEKFEFVVPTAETH